MNNKLKILIILLCTVFFSCKENYKESEKKNDLEKNIPRKQMLIPKSDSSRSAVKNEEKKLVQLKSININRDYINKKMASVKSETDPW